MTTEAPSKSIQEQTAAPVRRHTQNPTTAPVPDEAPTTEPVAESTVPGFPDLASLLRQHADELGKGENKPYEVTAIGCSRFVFTNSMTSARKIVQTTVRAVKSPEIIDALAAAVKAK